MAETIEQRDFFISFNSADLAYAQAIDGALKAAGFTTFYHPRDLPPGGNVPVWMDEALSNSGQTLALYSPDYVKDKAIYSKAERYATWWQDPVSDKRKLIPIVLSETPFTPLMAIISRIYVTGMTPNDAGQHVVSRLRTPEETEERDRWRVGLPLPKTFNVLYRHNPNFTGRFEAMEKLQNALREGNAAITAVAGMGGVGKTTLAAEYCHRFGGRYGGVWWVKAEQEAVMLADIALLSQRLGLEASNNIETDARTALDHLASRTEPWLMVYDNAPNADAVAQWLPQGAVRCLITSRFTGFDDIATVTRLDQWSDAVTADYLLARTGGDDRVGALRLADVLDGLPLAAEQAAVFLKNRKGISFDDYAKDITRLIKEERPAGAKGQYPDTVYAAFVKSLRALGGLKGGQTALDLLRICAFLSPDGVDLKLLMVDDEAEVLPADFAAAMADSFAREDALAALASLSLLRREEGPAGLVLIFHRLLLEVVRDWIGADAREHWGSAAVKLVDLVFPSGATNRRGDPSTDTSCWPACERLITHVAPLELLTPRGDRVNPALDHLLHQASLYLAIRGDGAGAYALAEKSVKLARLSGTENPFGLAASLNVLAAHCSSLNRLDEAETTYIEALAIREPRLDPKDPILAITRSNLAAVYLKRKQFPTAESLLIHASEIMKGAYGPESAEFGLSLANLGALYGEWTRGAQEEDYKARALSMTRAARGARHPATFLQIHNLAVMHSDRGNWAIAATQSEQALAIMLSLDLAQHPHAQHCADALIHFWRKSGEPEKATRLKAGDISDLLPTIIQIETEHHAWVAKDPNNRHFGPPSSFEQVEHGELNELMEALSAAGVDVDDLVRRVQAGQVSEAEFNKIVGKALGTSEDA